MRYIQKFSTSGAVQEALENSLLGKPYVAYVEDENKIDWDTLSPTPPVPEDLPYSAQPFTIEVTDTTEGNEINFFKIVPNIASQTAATKAPDKTLYYTINKPFTHISAWTEDNNPWKSDGQYVVHELHSNESITGLSDGDTVRFYTFVENSDNQDYPDLERECGPFGASGQTDTNRPPNNVPTNSFGHSTVGCVVYGNIMSLITGKWFEYYYEEPINPITQFQELSWASYTGRSTSRNIFLGLFCTSGTSADNKMHLYDAQNLVLPKDTRPGCYFRMFFRSEVMNSPALPALEMDKFCYFGMFENCNNLTVVSSLPAETLARGCYTSMFRNCTSLKNAPALPATTLAESCYGQMFQNCTSLENAPALPATTLVITCYAYMFNGCSNISEIICLATNPTTSACEKWLENVSSTGTFHKASGVTWPSGTSGIPDGWTVVDYIPNN